VKTRREVHLGDRVFGVALRLFGAIVILVVLGIVVELYRLGAPALSRFGWSFLWSSAWNPVTQNFGAAAFAYGTIVSSLIALLIAIPVSVGSALFLNEIAHRRIAVPVAFLIEMLAAIPSVVYGIWGVFVLAPWLRTSFQPRLQEIFGNQGLIQGPPLGVGMLCAGIILAIMIVPTIASVCREVFSAVPTNQREAALALGATRWEAIRIAVLDTSITGILSAVVLGLGRALGETMAVTMVIGNRAQIVDSLFAPAQTMASVIANEYPEASEPIHLASLASIGLVLFLISIIVQGIARWIGWVQNKRFGNAFR
jgi:phosphate transport system permease protein